LVDHDRLDGWLNYAYQALKATVTITRSNARPDAAESMPWLLDLAFALTGRVRPYHTYCPGSFANIHSRTGQPTYSCRR
jgi:hypothetical protein